MPIAPANWPALVPISNGEQAISTVFNRPHFSTSTRTDSLKTLLETVETEVVNARTSGVTVYASLLARLDAELGSSWSDSNMFLTSGSASWALGSTTLTYSAIVLVQPNLAFNYTINSGSQTLADGDCLYVTLSRLIGSATLTMTKCAAGTLPNNKDIYAIAIRYGNNVWIRDSGELEDGETRILGDGTTAAIMARLAMTDENDTTSHFTSNIINTSSDTIPAAISKYDLEHSYAIRDRNTVLTGGGDITWAISGTGTLTWASNLTLRVPAVGDVTITAGSVASIADGDCLYVTLVRASTNYTLAITRCAFAALPLANGSTSNIVIGIRNGTTFTFRTGDVFNDGNVKKLGEISVNDVTVGAALTNLRTVTDATLRNSLVLADNLLGEPFAVTYAANVVNIGASDYRTVYGDTISTVTNREYKVGVPVGGKYTSIAAATLNVVAGNTTGPFDAPTCPTVTANKYISLALELKSNGRWAGVFGTEGDTAAEAVDASHVAKFSNSSLVKRALVVLLKNGVTGTWNFTDPDYLELRVFPMGSGGGGSGTDLVPAFSSTTQFTVQATGGNKVRLNNKYYTLTNDLTITPTVATATYYICVDTTQPEGEVTGSYIVVSTIAPSSASFNGNYAVIGELVSNAGSITSVSGYSTREMCSWVNELPNIKRASEQKTVLGSYTLTTGFAAVPSIVTYRYWDDSASVFYDFSRSSIEVSCSTSVVNYTIPADPVIIFDAGDYFEVEAFYYNYQGTGFASPKTDSISGWYTSTPANTVAHSLGMRPLAIMLEFNRSGIYSVEDGSQYIDKASGGTEATQVTFDWSGLEVLSASNQMRISFHGSKLSAGAFTASTVESGTVTVTGLTTTVESPDLVLTSAHTSFATQINALADDSLVYLSQSVTVTAQQEITKRIRFKRKPGAKVICATAVTSIVKFSAECDIDMEVESQNTITNAIEFNANFVAKLRIRQNGSAKTLTNGMLVNTGFRGTAFGLVTADVGTISANYSDTDNLSIILL